MNSGMFIKDSKKRKMMEKEADKIIEAMENQEQNVPSMQKAKFIPPRIRPARKTK